MIMKTFTGKYDSQRKGLVNAESREAAANLLGISIDDFNDFWQEANFDYTKGENKVWTKPIFVYGLDWSAGRCAI